jgi:hypothetical protein
MPAKSKQQFRLMKAVAEGYVKLNGLSKSEAKDYTKSNTGKKKYSKLPDKVKTKK